MEEWTGGGVAMGYVLSPSLSLSLCLSLSLHVQSKAACRGVCGVGMPYILPGYCTLSCTYLGKVLALLRYRRHELLVWQWNNDQG
ncbi:hypothetical protein LZ31DRAFT_314136 [Colletotrichum somersetense]|nr:hypothetical protein LZ31DRAFT_314136 [Colletotrichum somersetense]